MSHVAHMVQKQLFFSVVVTVHRVRDTVSYSFIVRHCLVCHINGLTNIGALQIFIDMRTEYDDMKHRDERHWQNFLQCVAGLSQISNRTDDLEAVLDELWPLYCLPLEKGKDLGFSGHYDLFLAEYCGVRKEFTANYTKMKCILLTM